MSAITPHASPDAAATTDPPSWLKWPTAYMDHVADVSSTPGGRSDLCTGLSPSGLTEPWRMLPHVRARIPRYAPDTKIAYLAVAAMFAAQAPNPTTGSAPTTATAYHPDHGNLGWSLARAVHAGVLRPEGTTELLQRLARQRKLPSLIRLLQPVIGRLADEHILCRGPACCAI